MLFIRFAHVCMSYIMYTLFKYRQTDRSMYIILYIYIYIVLSTLTCDAHCSQDVTKQE